VTENSRTLFTDQGFEGTDSPRRSRLRAGPTGLAITVPGTHRVAPFSLWVVQNDGRAGDMWSGYNGRGASAPTRTGTVVRLRLELLETVAPR
jgi:hypothetical protein